VGGSAQRLWEPQAEQIPEVLQYCHYHGIPVHFLGRGSNTLVSDEGLDGLVLLSRQALSGLWQNGKTVIAEAGVPLPKLSKFVASLGYGGYDFLIGIPGTVGGGVAMNAGLSARGVRDMATILKEVELVTPQGDVRLMSAKALDLAHRSTLIQHEAVFILKARFKLEEEVPAEHIRHLTAQHLAERRRKQPLSQATAGSTFKQPKGDHSAGWYIDKAGLKGYQIGDAIVSSKHANWLVNTGAATAQNIRELISHIQEKVFDTFQVTLEREVRFLPQDSLFQPNNDRGD